MEFESREALRQIAEHGISGGDHGWTRHRTPYSSARWRVSRSAVRSRSDRTARTPRSCVAKLRCLQSRFFREGQMRQAARLVGSTASMFSWSVAPVRMAQLPSVCRCSASYSCSTRGRRTTVSPSLPSKNVVPVSSLVTRCFTSLTVAS